MAAKKPKTLEDIKLILSTFREAGVLSFEYEGVKVTFDPYAAKKSDMGSAPSQTSLDDKAVQTENLRQMLKEVAEDEDANLRWST